MPAVCVVALRLQLQDAIGRDEFERFAAEAEAEAGGTPAAAAGTAAAPAAGASGSSQPGAGRSGAEAAAGFGEEDLDDDSGFFDMPDDEQTAEAAAGSDADEGSSSSSSGGIREPVKWSRHDPNSFFAVNEDEVAEAESVWYSRRGPFDDLFGDAGDELVQQRQQQQKERSSKGKRSKGSSRAAQKQ